MLGGAPGPGHDRPPHRGGHGDGGLPLTEGGDEHVRELPPPAVRGPGARAPVGEAGHQGQPPLAGSVLRWQHSHLLLQGQDPAKQASVILSS